jgi:hypothetical protein
MARPKALAKIRHAAPRIRSAAFLAALVLSVVAAVGGVASPGAAAEPLDAHRQLPLPVRHGQQFVIDDFNNDVTPSQMGINYFGGACTLIASTPNLGGIGWSAESAGAAGGSLQLSWDFAPHGDPNATVGVCCTLFGPAEIKTSFDGREPRDSTPLPGYALDAGNLFGTSTPRLFAARSVEELQFDVKPQGPVVLRIELTDDAGLVGMTRIALAADRWQTLSMPLAVDAWRCAKGQLDLGRLKKISLIVERRHDRPQVAMGQNPTSGELLVDNILLVDRDGEYPDLNQAYGKPEYARALLELVRATSFLYFLDFASREPGCGGMVRDRSTFADLITVGGAGFQLTAYAIAAERGYLAREHAAARVRNLLKLLHDGPQGPESAGTIGHKGFFYHFLGIDGRRKRNFDQRDTPNIHESLNTVELSTIDTALALCGVLTARQYFDRPNDLEEEIRRRADAIYDRVDWPFMLDRATNQFYLGWKPAEYRDNRGTLFGRFAIDDSDKLGQYASKIAVVRREGEPESEREVGATLDYYTDEHLLIALLAIGAPSSQRRVDPSVFFSTLRERRGGSFVRTWTGSLFTYQFSSVWLDTQALGADRDPLGRAAPINYFENTRQAILVCRDYATRNPRGHISLSPTRFGLSACDGPFEAYYPEAAPVLAVATEPSEEDRKRGARGLDAGTLTVYGAGCSILHAPQESIDALWECQRLGLLHPRVGFADAFNLEIADAGPCSQALLRNKGPWVHPAGFAIDHGPMLILIDSYLEDHFAQKLFMSHPSVRRALAQLFPDWKP